MIEATNLAADKIKAQLEKRGKGLGIRIGVKTTGCSGLAYVLEYVDNEPDISNEEVYETNGVRIWVDKKSAAYLHGLSIDWIKQGLNEGFDFINPNERDRCGCGESFRV